MADDLAFVLLLGPTQPPESWHTTTTTNATTSSPGGTDASRSRRGGRSHVIDELLGSGDDTNAAKGAATPTRANRHAGAGGDGSGDAARGSIAPALASAVQQHQINQPQQQVKDNQVSVGASVSITADAVLSRSSSMGVLHRASLLSSIFRFHEFSFLCHLCHAALPETLTPSAL